MYAPQGTGESVWGGLYLWARSAKGKSSQSPHNKFIGLRKARVSWWMFTGQELNVSLP